VQRAVKRATTIVVAGQWNGASSVDRVVLDADERQCRRTVLTCENGTRFLLDLPNPTMLRDGDGLVLDDGSIVRVASKSEPLLEVVARSQSDLARFAWHLGNRHADVQVMGTRLRIRRDHVLEDMLRRLGARPVLIEAPFDPEPGAYVHAHAS
jgi:urease accessory protein